MRASDLNPVCQPPGPGRASVLATLQEQQESLQLAMRATESEFLTLGLQMESMSKTTDTIARLAGEVLEATTGRGGTGALQEATGTFARMFARAEARQTHYAEILGRLRDIGRRTATSLATRETLERVLADFGPLAMGFRIEIARLGETDAGRFLALTETITGVQAQALGIATRYFAKLDDMLGFIAAMQQRLAAHSTHVAENLSYTRHSFDEHLASLKTRWWHASRAGAAADAAVRDIILQIGKIVVATQYQDIAHQKIEHVSQAIDEIRRRFEDPGNEQSGVADFINRAGIVQCQQLEVVADEVDTAGRTIVREMGGIVQSAGNLACCDSVAESCSNDLVDAFQNDIRSMTELDEAGSAISDELASWIGPAVEALSGFAAEMRKHSEHLRFTAVNAQVVAGRVHQGRAVVILAKELRLGADSCLLVIDQMSRFVADVNHDLSGDLDQSRIAAIAEGRELRQETTRVTELLQKVQAGVRSNVAELRTLYGKLQESTQCTVSQIDLQATVVNPVRRVKSVIQALVNSLDANESGQPDSSKGLLAALRESYTMESERRAHDGATLPFREQTGTVSAAVLVATNAGSLGDNVELF